MSLREDGSWPREDEQPAERRLEEVVGKGTEAGKGALTLPSVRPGVGLPPTSSSSVPPRVCHHRHRPSVRLSLRTPTIRPVTLVSHMSRFFALLHRRALPPPLPLYPYFWSNGSRRGCDNNISFPKESDSNLERAFFERSFVRDWLIRGVIFDCCDFEGVCRSLETVGRGCISLWIFLAQASRVFLKGEL